MSPASVRERVARLNEHLRSLTDEKVEESFHHPRVVEWMRAHVAVEYRRRRDTRRAAFRRMVCPYPDDYRGQTRRPVRLYRGTVDAEGYPLPRMAVPETTPPPALALIPVPRTVEIGDVSLPRKLAARLWRLLKPMNGGA